MPAPSSTTCARVVTAFAVTAVVEAVTWAGLLVGMLLEHVLHVTDLGVFVFGRLHGAAFLLYCGAAVLTWWCRRWHPVTGLVALAAGVPPFGTVVFERWARRRGLLTDSPQPSSPRAFARS